MITSGYEGFCPDCGKYVEPRVSHACYSVPALNFIRLSRVLGDFLCITPDGRWLRDGKDITDDAAVLRAVFLEFARLHSK